MPKLALSLGLADEMPDMIEELISKGQQLDAVHFTYEVGLVDKFPPVPLLKSYLKDAKKVASSILEDPNNAGRAATLAARKEQSALRAVIKCIEEYKLEDEFPPENLKKRLDQLEKVKTDKKKPVVVPANKRTRASNSNGGPMPPAKAGRLTNAYVSSFPAAPAFVRSPSHGQYPAALPAYPSPPHMYGSRSPPLCCLLTGASTSYGRFIPSCINELPCIWWLWKCYGTNLSAGLLPIDMTSPKMVTTDMTTLIPFTFSMLFVITNRFNGRSSVC